MRQDSGQVRSDDEGSAIDGALDWLRAALAEWPPGAGLLLPDLARACPFDAALLYEAIGFLEREERVTLRADMVFVIRPGG